MLDLAFLMLWATGAVIMALWAVQAWHCNDEDVAVMVGVAGVGVWGGMLLGWMGS